MVRERREVGPSKPENIRNIGKAFRLFFTVLKLKEH